MGDIWGAFVRLLEQVMLWFYGLTGNGGVAIILFTITVRLIILPLTVQSIRSSRRMAEVQPLLKEIQRKHGKEPAKLQEETIKLYREQKINPVGGCLPIFFQLPIFLGVYQAVTQLTRVSPAEHAGSAMLTTLEAAGKALPVLASAIGQPQLAGSFLWLPDLGKPDPLFILGVLSVLFQFMVQLMSMPRVMDPQQKAMMNSMLIMPFLFGFAGFTFPAGAVLYWVIGSLLSMIQTYAISGWGSLANYLKFLPVDSGFFPTKVPVAAIAGVGTTDAAPAADDKINLWDLLKPLIDERPETTPEPAAVASESPTLTNQERRRAAQARQRRRSSR